VFGRLLLIFGKIAAIKKSAMHFGMKRFDAAAEHLRPAGEFRDVFDGNAGVAKEFCGAAGGENFDFERGEALGEIENAGFVKNTDECALHCGHADPPTGLKTNSVAGEAKSGQRPAVQAGSFAS